MNRLEVQNIYNRLNKENDIDVIKYLGFKSCVFYDLFGMACTEPMKDEDVYLHVNDTLKSLCEYALDIEPHPIAKDCNGDLIYINGTVWFDNAKYLVHAYMPKSATRSERILVTSCDVWETPMWLYLGGNDVTVRNPNAQAVDLRSSLEDAASALRALQDTLQKDVFSKLETVLESLREAQKD